MLKLFSENRASWKQPSVCRGFSKAARSAPDKINPRFLAGLSISVQVNSAGYASLPHSRRITSGQTMIANRSMIALPTK